MSANLVLAESPNLERRRVDFWGQYIMDTTVTTRATKCQKSAIV